MPEPTDMILPMLRQMRAEMREGFASLDREFDRLMHGLDTTLQSIAGQVDAVEAAMRMPVGGSILRQYADARVWERLADIERRLAAIESRS